MPEILRWVHPDRTFGVLHQLVYAPDPPKDDPNRIRKMRFLYDCFMIMEKQGYDIALYTHGLNRVKAGTVRQNAYSIAEGQSNWATMYAFARFMLYRHAEDGAWNLVEEILERFTDFRPPTGELFPAIGEVLQVVGRDWQLCHWLVMEGTTGDIDRLLHAAGNKINFALRTPGGECVADLLKGAVAVRGWAEVGPIVERLERICGDHVATSTSAVSASKAASRADVGMDEWNTGLVAQTEARSISYEELGRKLGKLREYGERGDEDVTDMIDSADFFNEYDIDVSDERIGRGGFGEVVRARLHGAAVVVKFAHHDMALGQFLAEFKVQRQLQGHGTVPLYGYCKVVRDGVERFGAVMPQYARDLTADIRLSREEGEMPWARKWYLMSSVIRGLLTMHSRRVYHFDLKASNVFITVAHDAEHAGRLERECGAGVSVEWEHSLGQLSANLFDAGVVGDFGLAQLSNGQAGALGVSHWYAPPEQYSSNHARAKTDIFALGRLLLQIATSADPRNEKVRPGIDGYAVCITLLGMSVGCALGRSSFTDAFDTA